MKSCHEEVWIEVPEKRVAIFGFGSQGKAQALNLRDSGWEVTVVVRPGSPSMAKAEAEGLRVSTDAASIARASNIITLLVADHAQPAVWEMIASHLPTHAAVIFAHGYNVHYQKIRPRKDLDLLLVAPIGPGVALRQRYCDGGTSPIVTAIHQDASGRAETLLQQYTRDITNNAAEIIPSTMAEETETNLFAEQALLVGGLSHLMQAVYETMVQAGYNERLAHVWCHHGTRDLAAHFAQFGIEGGYQRVSRTAAHGGSTRGPRIINAQTRATLQAILKEIQDGSYAHELSNDITPQ